MKDFIVNILVGRKKIEWIAYNHKLSSHAEMQMLRRGATSYNLTGAILNSPLSWKLPDNYIAIALNLYEYIVVVDKLGVKEAIVVTYVSMKDDGYTVIDKMLTEYQKAVRAGG